MAELHPFRGIVFNVSAVRPEDVACPPARYLTPVFAELFRQKHPHNAVHLFWPEKQDPPGDILEHWRREGILVQDRDPACYVLSQSFRNSQGVMVQRFGLLALCRLTEFSEHVVVPHQRTLPALLEGSVKRLQRLNAHLQPVCLLAEDVERRMEGLLRGVAEGAPVLDFILEGVIIRLWRVVDPEWISDVQREFRPLSLLLGAGHHDYEAALTYRDMMRLRTRAGNTPFDFIPVMVTGMKEETILLRPVIRLVRPGRAPDWDAFFGRLSKYFRLTPVGSLVELAQLPGGSGRHAFGVIGPDRLLLAQWEGSAPLEEITDPAAPPYVRELDVSILHHFFLGKCLGMDEVLQQRLEHVSYARDLPEAVGCVQRDEAAMAFVTSPLTLDHLRRLMRSRAVVPPATTALAPAIPSGVIIHRLDGVTP
jgi:uncharacterized protein (DUF1015 family)